MPLTSRQILPGPSRAASSRILKPLTGWVSRFRERRMAGPLSRLARDYQQEMSDREAADWQLARFNRLWQDIRRCSPYWKARSADLPARFASWTEFSACVPPLDRALVQGRGRELSRGDLAVRSRRATGGSTGEPLQFPVCRQELETSRLNLWLGRSRFGIRPSDRLFLIWGHSHSLPTGWRGHWARWARRVADAGLGYLRWSAYDLGGEALRSAGDAILAFQPRYLLGYSVALARFAEVNHRRGSDFRRLGLTAVVATAEAFPRSESARRLERLLACPVVMEYGAVETGPLAYARFGRPYQAFWRDFYLESLPAKGSSGRHELLVTSLSERSLPLIRYRIGDLLEAPPAGSGFPREIPNIVGRCNDFLEMSDGTPIHSEAFSHALMSTAALQMFQVRQPSRGAIEVLYQAARELTLEEEREISRRLAGIHAELSRAALRRVKRLEPSMAGKTKVIVREGEPG